MPIVKVLGASEVWAAWAVAVTWQLAALAVAAWVIQRVLRLRQPGARYGLWWFVLVVPLVLAPVRFALAERHASVGVVAPAAVARVTAVSLATPEFSPPVPAGLSASVPEEVFTSPEYQAALREHGKRETLCQLVFLAWLLGCAAMGVRLLVGHWRVSRLVGRSRLADGSTVAEVFQRLGVSGLRLYESEEVGAPMVCGLRSPCIVFPKGWLDTVERPEVESLLAHEVGHVKRRDVAANLVQRLIEIPLYFHPGVRLANREITHAREELADRWALSTGADAETYARALTTAAERAQVGFAGAAVGIAENKSTLRRRVEAIVGGRHVGRVGSLLASLLLAVGLVAAVALAAIHVVDREQAEPKVSDARFLHDDTPLTTAQVNAALASAGVRVCRLSYHFPTEHRLDITIEQYRDGERVRSERQARLDQTAGANSLTIAVREKPESVAFDFYETRGGMVGLGDLPLPAGGSRAWGEIWAGRELQAGRKVPVFSYSSNREERGGISGSRADDISGMAAEYDFLYVVFAEVVLPEEADAGEAGSRGATTLVQGMLRTPDGKPAAGVTVHVEGLLDSRHPETYPTQAVTGEDGRFEIVLSATAGKRSLWVWDERFFAILARDIESRTGGKLTLPPVILERSGRIEGRVLNAARGEPLSGVRVSCAPVLKNGASAGPVRVEVKTSSNGAFAMAAPPGEAFLQTITPAGYTWSHLVTEEKRYRNRSVLWVHEDPDRPASRRLAVRPGDTLAGVDLFLVRALELRGRVLAPDGTPWKRGGPIYAEAQPGRVEASSHISSLGMISADGTFQIDGLMSEVPTVIFVLDEQRGLGGAALVTPSVRQEHDTTIKIEPLALVRGRVLLPDGSPAVGAAVEVDGLFRQVVFGERLPPVRSGQDGTFELRQGIVGVPWRLSATLPPWTAGGPYPEYYGWSGTFTVAPRQAVVDVGDIVVRKPSRPGAEQQ